MVAIDCTVEGLVETVLMVCSVERVVVVVEEYIVEELIAVFRVYFGDGTEALNVSVVTLVVVVVVAHVVDGVVAQVCFVDELEDVVEDVAVVAVDSEERVAPEWCATHRSVL